MPPIDRVRALRSPSSDSEISEIASTATTRPPSHSRTTSPARNPGRRTAIARPHPDVIEISDDDDDVEIVGAAGPSRTEDRGERSAGPARNPQAQRIPQAEYDNTMAELDAALARRGQALRELENARREQRTDGPARRNDAPARRNADGPRINLGGAVLRRGNNEVHFAPGQNPQRLRMQRDGAVLENQHAPQVTRRRTRALRDYAHDHPDYDPDYFPDEEDDLFQEDTQHRQARRRRNERFRAFDHAHDLDPDEDMVNPRGGWGFGRVFGLDLDMGQIGTVAQYIQGLGHRRYLEHAVNALPGLGLGLGRGGAGPARPGPQDVATILAKVEPSKVPTAKPGFTYTWDVDELAKEDKGRTVIQLDEDGAVMPVSKAKPYLACAACPEPLRVSAGERTPDDRVWALRCGHMLDQRCLDRLASGPDETPQKKRKTAKNQPREFAWPCPIEGCGKEHVSQFKDGVWAPKEGAGAIQVYI